LCLSYVLELNKDRTALFCQISEPNKKQSSSILTFKHRVESFHSQNLEQRHCLRSYSSTKRPNFRYIRSDPSSGGQRRRPVPEPPQMVRPSGSSRRQRPPAGNRWLGTAQEHTSPGYCVLTAGLKGPPLRARSRRSARSARWAWVHSGISHTHGRLKSQVLYTELSG
jgi:hypothetical protein